MRFEYLSRMAITLTLGSLSTIYAASVYNEAVSGDLSNSGLTPTALSFSSGSNQVSGTTGNSNGFDRDYFTFTVPSGNQLTSIIESAGTSVGALSLLSGFRLDRRLPCRRPRRTLQVCLAGRIMEGLAPTPTYFPI